MTQLSQTALQIQALLDAVAGKATLTDLTSTAPGKGASQIGIQDAAGLYASVTAEGALIEIGKKQQNTVSILEFGEASSDDTALFNSAISAIKLLGHGTIIVPYKGTPWKISSSVVVDSSSIRIIGVVPGSYHYVAPTINAPVIVEWIGAAGGDMFVFSPGGSQWISGNEFDGIYLSGDLGGPCAGRGLVVMSSVGGKYNVVGTAFSTALIDLGCSSTLAETADCMQNEITVRGNMWTSGALLRMNGTATANVCFNRIKSIDGNYSAGDAVIIGNADNNIFDTIRLHRSSGTNYGVVLQGGAANNEARQNIFIDLSPGLGGLIAKGTPAYSSASHDNYILAYDTLNGAPLPVYETGATLFYNTLDGKFPSVSAVATTGTYGAGPTDIEFDTEIFDLTSCFVTPAFTAKKPGKYKFTLKISHGAGVTVGDKWVIYLVTTSETPGCIYHVQSAADNTLIFESTVNLLYNQTAKFTIQRSSGTGSFPVIADGRFNRLDINYISQGF